MTPPVFTSGKRLLALRVTTALDGCSVYPAPGYGAYESDNPFGQPDAVGNSPALISGSVTDQQNIGGSGCQGNGQGPAYGRGPGDGRGRGDPDGDDAPNRFDRDRDGDAIRNRRDGHPNNRGRR